MSIKPRNQRQYPIRTAYDARLEKLRAEAELAAKQLEAHRKLLVRKVQYWQEQVVCYGGEVQQLTLQRFEAQLATLNNQ